MIAFIEGILADVTENTVIIDCHGIGYELFVPQPLYRSLPAAGERLRLHTFLQLREDGVSLFGFTSRDDLNVFRLLITVSGIGPKGALGILSAMTADELRFAVLAGDAKSIAKAPGIGAKTAGKVILDLKDKFHLEDALEQKLSHAAGQLTASSESGAAEEAVQALIALGYSPADALRAVKKTEVSADMTAEEILKLSLKNIGR